jgi:hypothetical protein
MIASVTVGTTETQVLPPPSGRPWAFVAIGNNGPRTAYLKLVPDADAVTTSNGVPLAVDSVMICDQDMQKELFRGSVTAIASSGTTTISVQAF